MDWVSEYINSNPRMPELLEKSKLPVYLHIPKCGGTFVRVAIYEMLRLYCGVGHGKVPRDWAATIEVGAGGDPDLVVNGVLREIPEDCRVEGTNYTMSRDRFLDFARKGEMDIFAVIATSEMWASKSREVLVALEEICGKKFCFFATFKDPFERALSMYYVQKQRGVVLNSFFLPANESSLEEFSAFLTSYDSEPNWASQFLDYLGTKNVRIGGLDRVVSFLSSFFSEIYHPVVGMAAEFSGGAVNVTQKESVYRLEELSAECVSAYLNLHARDIDLWSRVEG